MNEVKEIIILFKTHLDVGFTNLSENVLNSYIKDYIPNAVRVAKALRDKPEKFIWTVGSWLIDIYLKNAGSAAIEELADAITHGDICWHGLPFTTHTELMNEALFCYGLSISNKLDMRFGKKTIAAKLTDVPGHTKAIIPYMADAGIQFLHIGVNPASSVPKVPDMFRWQSDCGKEIIVMYNCDYGDFSMIPNSETAIYFAHTGDNHGPQSPEQIINVYKKLQEKYPNAKLRAGTLNDVAELACKVENLPVVTSEIGDTWIHGAGSDPAKVSGLRSQLRFAATLEKDLADAMYEQLLPIPEHTWGLDEKTHLGGYREELSGEHDFFVKKDFLQAKERYKFKKMELSWLEQREYLRNSVASLQAAGCTEMPEAPYGFTPPYPVLSNYKKLASNEASIGDYNISFSKTGAINSLSFQNTVLADSAHIWGELCYEAFSLNEYDSFMDSYVVSREGWAIEDFGKIGMEKAISKKLVAYPKLNGLYQNGNELLVELCFDGDAVELYGAPKKAVMTLSFEDRKVNITLAWYEKDASRVAEAIWFGFHPLGEGCELRKLSKWINPFDVVDNGNKRLHATDFGVRFGEVSIETLDSAIVCVGKPNILEFSNKATTSEDGIYFNLVNNVWGTNFVMWYGQDAGFRYTVTF